MTKIVIKKTFIFLIPLFDILIENNKFSKKFIYISHILKVGKVYLRFRLVHSQIKVSKNLYKESINFCYV